MDILFVLAIISLVLFMVLATYDGLYLHLFKYALFNRKESRFEHQTHTIRAVLFPLIIWSLFLNETNFTLFLVGLLLVLLDMLVLGVDAHSEKDSRSFMGGLPRWEYIIHLFSNAFHFSTIAIILAMRLKVWEGSLVFVNSPVASNTRDLFQFVATNVMPGAIALAFLHVILMLEKPKNLWIAYRSKITCC